MAAEDKNGNYFWITKCCRIYLILFSVYDALCHLPSGGALQCPPWLPTPPVKSAIRWRMNCLLEKFFRCGKRELNLEHSILSTRQSSRLVKYIYIYIFSYFTSPFQSGRLLRGQASSNNELHPHPWREPNGEGRGSPCKYIIKIKTNSWITSKNFGIGLIISKVWKRNNLCGH